MASHEEKVPLSDDDLYASYSEDDSESGSLSDAYFLKPSDRETPTSLTYSPTSPTGKTSSSKTTCLHPGEHDPLYIPIMNDQAYSSYHYRGYGSSQRAIQEDEPDEMFLEEAKLASFTDDPIDVLPQHSSRKAINAQDKRQLRQLRRKQHEQIERERAVQKVRGTPQETFVCHDSVFAALFVAQLVLVIFCAIKFGSGLVFWEKGWSPFSRMTEEEQDEDLSTLFLGYTDDHVTSITEFVSGGVKGAAKEISKATISFVLNFRTVMSIAGITGFYACILSLFTVGFMLIIAKSLIQTALIFCIILSLAWGIIGYALAPQHVLVPLLGCIAVILLVGYTVVVWDRIPFAATNLHTALCAMRSTADITLLGMSMIGLSFAWCLVWCMAFIGLVDTSDECSPSDKNCREHLNHSHAFLYIMFVFSFCWTNLVIKNIVRSTVASAVGTWWFHPEEMSPCCSKAVRRAFLRSVTTSLGSICLGSLVALPSQIITQLGRLCCISAMRYRPNGRRDSCCGCMDGISRWLRRCNRWSFSYIGMYGYNFMEGGEKAIQLFETREWMDVVNDNLIHNVLFMASVVIGGSTGTFGVLVEEVDGYTFSSFNKPIITAFLIGWILGFVLSNILLLGVVGSAVNTILVCFAAGPFEFHKNHPRLSAEMRDSWSQQVWEDSV